MRILFIPFIFVVQFSANAVEDNKLVIAEKDIIQFTSMESPTLDQIEAQFRQAQLNYVSIDRMFDPTFNLGGQQVKTKERALFSFAPVFSPTRTVYSSLEKINRSGTAIGLTVSNDQRSATSGIVNKANTTTVELGVKIDLWKNFLGATTKSQTESLRLDFEKAKIEKEIALKSFQYGLRKLYWGLVANQESIKISEALFQTAIQQAEDAKRRLANSISDKSEVARYESQVAARKSSLLYLQYQRENLIKQLKELIPGLNSKDIEIGEYDLSNTIVKVLECTTLIGATENVPMDFTQFDEIAKVLQVSQSYQQKAASKVSSPDLGLDLAYQVRGVDSPAQGNGPGSMRGSIRDFEDNNRDGFRVGLKLSVPFGESTATAEEASEVIANKRYQAEINKMLSEMNATHQQLKRSITILTDVIRNQKFNSQKLKERLSEMKRKYNQARISVNDLINDQDALLNSDLSIVQTQLEVVNMLLDYLVVFSETPCSFNRI
jgi:outer membrane protein TolC